MNDWKYNSAERMVGDVLLRIEYVGGVWAWSARLIGDWRPPFLDAPTWGHCSTERLAKTYAMRAAKRLLKEAK